MKLGSVKKYLLLVLFLAALVAGGLYFEKVTEERRIETLRTTGLTASGRVIDSSGKVDINLIEYKDRKGNVHYLEDRYSKEIYKPGKRLTVVYDAKNPESAIVKEVLRKKTAKERKTK